MKIKPSSETHGIVGISGHAGAGHVHSHAGFVQDDSGGFAVAAYLLQQAYPVNSKIAAVKADIDKGIITISTEDGGTGSAWARRGLTPFEVEIMQRAVGKDAILTQSTAFQALGRIYGQGILETPVALQSAVALALIDTFKKKWPEVIHVAEEDMEDKVGKIMGTVIEIEGTPVSLLAVVNASSGGIGPEEDLEGNVLLGAKGKLMKELALDRIPTIIVESKAFVPGLCDSLSEDTIWIRENKNADNTIVAGCLAEAAKNNHIAYIHNDEAYPRGTGEMKTATQKLAKRIVEIGNQLYIAETSHEKVKIIGDLALLTSQDAGGVTYMTNSLHDVVGGGGILPGTSAVISQLVTSDYIKYWKIPAVTMKDVEKYSTVITGAVIALSHKIEKAEQELREKLNFNVSEFDFLYKR